MEPEIKGYARHRTRNEVSDLGELPLSPAVLPMRSFFGNRPNTDLFLRGVRFRQSLRGY